MTGPAARPRLPVFNGPEPAIGGTPGALIGVLVPLLVGGGAAPIVPSDEAVPDDPIDRAMTLGGDDDLNPLRVEAASSPTLSSTPPCELERLGERVEAHTGG